MCRRTVETEVNRIYPSRWGKPLFGSWLFTVGYRAVGSVQSAPDLGLGFAAVSSTFSDCQASCFSRGCCCDLWGRSESFSFIPAPYSAVSPPCTTGRPSPHVLALLRGRLLPCVTQCWAYGGHMPTSEAGPVSRALTAFLSLPSMAAELCGSVAGLRQVSGHPPARYRCIVLGPRGYRPAPRVQLLLSFPRGADLCLGCGGGRSPGLLLELKPCMREGLRKWAGLCMWPHLAPAFLVGTWQRLVDESLQVRTDSLASAAPHYSKLAPAHTCPLRIH